MHTQHTPGPWKIITLDGHTYINPLRPEGEWGLIAKIGTSAHKKGANAALIAAAPDLLAALIRITELADRLALTSPRLNPEVDYIIPAARAAIARATGGAP